MMTTTTKTTTEDDASRSSSTRGSATRITYQPALDGVRAVAVAMVLLFHAGASWMHGGYIGVSVFFTLSGYLITALLNAEYNATGRVNLGEFYGRRIKRLMPASVVCLFGVVLLSARGWYPTASHVRREAIASALQVANWNSLTQRTSYADLVLGGTGPLDHFWSLAVEEQFYWIWPLAFLAIARFAMTPTRRVLPMVVVAGLAIGAAPLIAAAWGPDVAYWSTPARLGEILTGAALAMVLSRPNLVRSWWVWMAAVGCVAILGAAVLLPRDHGFAYQGWLGVGSLVSVALIAGLQVHSPLSRALSVRPLVELGRISYGVYVFHWPIFLLLTRSRTGWSGPLLFVARTVVTLAIASASYVLLEQPLRRRSIRPRRVASMGALAALAVVLIATVVVQTPTSNFGASVDAQRQVAIVQATSELPPPRLGPNDVPSRPVRVLVLGDSTAEALSAGMISWAADHPAAAQVSTLATPGCGFVRSVGMRDDDGTMQAQCKRVLDVDLSSVLTQTPPDVVVVMITLPDLTPRTWSSQEGELSPTDGRYIERKASDYSRMIKQLVASGVAKVLWLASPLPSTAWLGYLNGDIDPQLWRAQQDAIATLARDSPVVITVPFDDWLTAQERNDPRALRPDGLHLSAAGAERAMDGFLANIIVTAGSRAP